MSLLYRVAGIVGANRVGIARDSQIVSMKMSEEADEDVSTNPLRKISDALLRRNEEDLNRLSDWEFRGSVWLM